MTSTPEKYHGEDNIEFTTQLIMTSYELSYQDAHNLAIKALNGLDAHGGTASDHASIHQVVRVVVSSWLGINSQ